MRGTVVAAFVAGLAALAAPPSRATAPSEHHGGCGFDAVKTAPTNGDATWVGDIDVLAVLHSPDVAGNPVSATITCEIAVNGVVREQGLPSKASFSGTGVVVGVAPASYVAASTDLVELCETVDFTSDATPTTTECVPVFMYSGLDWCEHPPGSVPPPGWCDLLD